MSTLQKPQTQNKTAKPASAPAPQPAVTKKAESRASKTMQPKREFDLLFDKENYLLMAAGVTLIFIGFMLMSGGKSPDPHKFLYDEIYSIRRITIAPIVILLGFGLEVYAIMKLPKDAAQQSYDQEA